MEHCCDGYAEIIGKTSSSYAINNILMRMYSKMTMKRSASQYAVEAVEKATAKSQICVFVISGTRDATVRIVAGMACGVMNAEIAAAAKMVPCVIIRLGSVVVWRVGRVNGKKRPVQWQISLPFLNFSFSCESPCPAGQYGMMCKSICECSSSKCHPQTGECLMDDSLILFDWTTPSADTNVMRITKERIEASHWLKVENGSIVNETLKSTEGYQILRNEIQKLLQTTEISVEAVNFTNLDSVEMQKDNITLKVFNKTTDSIIIPLNISSADGTQISERVANQKPNGNLRDEDSQLIINIKIDHNPTEKSVTEPVSLNSTPASDLGLMLRSSNTTILTNNENDIVAVLQETSDPPLPFTDIREDLDTTKAMEEMERIKGSPLGSLNTTIVTNHQNDIVAVLQESSSNRDDIAEVVSNQTDFVDSIPTKEEASDTGLRSRTSNTTILTNNNNEIVAVLQDHSDHPIYVNLMEHKVNRLWNPLKNIHEIYLKTYNFRKINPG